MAVRLIIDGNAVYEIDEECLKAQQKKGELQMERSEERQKRRNVRKEQSEEPK
ncbi:MAG: hypothetical protein Q4F28_04535 [Eubacteriales bacterium]|nr:hypothetical protein [Eubacteriales bacterium]